MNKTDTLRELLASPDTLVMPVAELRACGVARVSLPAVALFAAIAAVRRVLGAVRDSQDFSQILHENLLASSADVSKLLTA